MLSLSIKSICLFVFMAVFYSIVPSTFAQENTELITDDLVVGSEKITLQYFDSCSALEDSLSKYLTNAGSVYGGGRLRGGIVPMPMMEGIAVDSAMGQDIAQTSEKSLSIASESSEYSTTNLQYEGVDESDIVKVNQNFVFYYNAQESKIYQIKSPLDIQTKSLNFTMTDIIGTIVLPSDLYNVQLFLQDNQLLIVGDRYAQSYEKRISIVARSSRTLLAIYDVSPNQAMKLKKVYDFDGNHSDMRIVDGTLHLVTNVYLDRYTIMNATKKFTIQDYLPSLVSVDPKNLQVDTQRVNCSNVGVLLPDDESTSQYGSQPSFAVLYSIDLQQIEQEPTINILFGSVDQIHMSNTSLYVLSNIWFPQPWTCPINARCSNIRFDQGQQTRIHKYSLIDKKPVYTASTLVQGSLLSQYSIDEDAKGNMRILTRKNRQDGTNLYILDPSLGLLGKLESIMPGEEFKSSRYIGDALYLVTFETTDPLFVIDLKDPTKPTIIGELKIPGYSTYLHPLNRNESGKQYLLGIGYDTALNQRGGVENLGIKFDIYEVDYTQTVPSSGSKQGYIKVTQRDTKTLGGKGSMTPVLQNPRLFVMDANDTLTVPLYLSREQKNGEECRIFIDAQGQEKRSDCYPVTEMIPEFFGLQQIKFTKSTQTIATGIAINYLDKYLTSGSNYFDGWSQTADMRVGYIGDGLYMLTHDFAHFFHPLYKGQNPSYEKFMSFGKSE